MRTLAILVFLFSFSFGIAQSLPIDFEMDITTDDFIDFDGGTATVIPNPQMNNNNTSNTVAQIIRDGGEVYAGSKIVLESALDFTTLNTISMKVYTSAPIGTIVKFKLEGAGAAERDVLTTVSNGWEVLTWDFTGVPNIYNTIVFMFDFDNLGDGSANSTFLFDDIEQLFGGVQIDLPVDFEDAMVNYTMTDFDGNQSTLVSDPENTNNTVMRVIKPTSAGATAGTTIGTPAGFATDIPITLEDSEMTVRVWSPQSGIPIRLKIEDANDPTHTCETETNTTLSNQWEVLTFDFNDEAQGTELLSVGLSMGWTYNKASIFFNFGTDGASVGERTYYFDDVTFGELVLSTSDNIGASFKVYPNPTVDSWTITSGNFIISQIELFDLQGRMLQRIHPNNTECQVDASKLSSGQFFGRITTNIGTSSISLLKR